MLEPREFGLQVEIDYHDLVPLFLFVTHGSRPEEIGAPSPSTTPFGWWSQGSPSMPKRVLTIIALLTLISLFTYVGLIGVAGLILFIISKSVRKEKVC